MERSDGKSVGERKFLISSDRNGSDGSSRRAFLTTAAAVAGSALLSPTAAAATAKQKKKQRYQEALRAFSNQNLDKTKALLDKIGVDYWVQHRNTPQMVPRSTDESAVSPQDYYVDDRSDLSMLVSEPPFNSDQYQVSLDWNIQANQSDRDTADPVDVAAISWDGSQLGYVGGSERSVAYLHAFDASTRATTKVKAPPHFDGAGNAIAWSLNDAEKVCGDVQCYVPSRFDGVVGCKLWKQGYPDRRPGVVLARYTHTWSLGPSDWIDPLGAVTIAKSGVGVTIELPNGVWSWDELYEGNY